MTIGHGPTEKEEEREFIDTWAGVRRAWSDVLLSGGIFRRRNVCVYVRRVKVEMVSLSSLQMSEKD